MKRFGPATAVSDLNLVLERGDVFGFIGPNGAGKTTTLRILATVLSRTSGEVTVAGHRIDDVEAVRPIIGYMPDFFGVYEDLTVKDYLEFFTRVYDIEPHQRSFAVEETMAFTGIGKLSEHSVDDLSRGQKQRLGLARTLLHNPQLLLLDEPASGLDPEARIEFRDIVHQLRQRGTTVLISSHVLPDLADMCNKVGIIDAGSMRWSGETAALLSRQQGAMRVRLRVLGDADRARQMLLEMPDVSELGWSGSDVVFDLRGTDRTRAQILRALIDAEIEVSDFSMEQRTLERVYMDLLAQDRSAAAGRLND